MSLINPSTNTTNITNTTDNKANESRSRFAYHGNEPEEGGVSSVVSKEGQGNRGTAPGVPGPEECLLDISELVRNIGMRYTHNFRIPAQVIPDLVTSAPTVGSVTLTNTGGLLLLKGQASTTLEMECYRCLTLTPQAVEVELDEAFPLMAVNNAYHQTEVQAVDEDTPTAVITGNVLDLGDLLRQELTVAAPVQPLCREECPGLLKPEDIAPEPITPEAVETRRPFEGLDALWRAREEGGK